MALLYLNSILTRLCKPQKKNRTSVLMRPLNVRVERGFVYSKIVDELTYDMDNIRDKWDFDTELTHDEYDAIICGFESERESAQ